MTDEEPGKRRRKSRRVITRRRVALFVLICSLSIIGYTQFVTIPKERLYVGAKLYPAEVRRRYTRATGTGAASLTYMTVRYRDEEGRKELDARVRESFFRDTRVGERVIVQVVPGSEDLRRIRDGSEPSIATRYIIAAAGIALAAFLYVLSWQGRARARRRRHG